MPGPPLSLEVVVLHNIKIKPIPKRECQVYPLSGPIDLSKFINTDGVSHKVMISNITPSVVLILITER